MIGLIITIVWVFLSRLRFLFPLFVSFDSYYSIYMFLSFEKLALLRERGHSYFVNCRMVIETFFEIFRRSWRGP